jgi:hypothetical protein
MIETPDKKRFFTHKKNYNQILDFANSFNCEISTVKLEDGEVLDLVPLAEAISNQQTCKRPKFEVIELNKPRKYNRSSK